MAELDARDATTVESGGKKYLQSKYLPDHECVYKSLEEPCDLCKKRNLNCNQEEKVLGPIMQLASKEPQWIRKYHGQMVLSFKNSVNSVHETSVQTSTASISNLTPTQVGGQQFEITIPQSPNSTWQLPERPLAHPVASEVFRTTFNKSSLPLSPGLPLFETNPFRTASELTPHPSQSMIQTEPDMNPRPPEWSPVAVFTPKEIVRLRAFLKRRIFKSLLLPTPDWDDIQPADKRVVSERISAFIFGSSPSKAIAFSVLAYECFYENEITFVVPRLQRCVEALPQPSSLHAVEWAYALSLALKVCFALRLPSSQAPFPPSQCRHLLVEFSRLFEVFRLASSSVTSSELLWLQTSMVSCFRQYFDFLCDSISLSPHTSDLSRPENYNLFLGLDQALSSWSLHHFTHCSITLWSFCFETSLHYYFAWFAFQVNAAHDGVDTGFQDPNTIMQNFYDSIPDPVTSRQNWTDDEFADLETPPFVYATELQPTELAFSNNITSNLFHAASASGFDPKPLGLEVTVYAWWLCQLVRSRNWEVDHRKDVKDLFLAGIFTERRLYPNRIPYVDCFLPI